MRIFEFQAESNPTYASYLKGLGIERENVRTISQIPFLPISFFKTKKVKSGDWIPEVVYSSSGTTGQDVSRHEVWSLQFYKDTSAKIFSDFFGPISNFHFLALLPSYLERQGSSLIDMMDYFIRESGSAHSGFYLNNHDELIAKIESLRISDKKVILWGVSFALLDLADRGPFDWSHCLVFETGGMKGRRQEIVREDLHSSLKKAFNLDRIYSEYGMTELLSQAYSVGDGYFACPPWMKIVVRDPNDPFGRVGVGKTGGVNIIDLANFHSCSFIETQDLGVIGQNGVFEVIGRFDNSDIRGCNLLLS